MLLNKSQIKTFYYFKEFAFIVAGIFSAGFGLKSFLLPSHFIDGGVTGISLLVSAVTGLPLAILIAVINIPFIILGYKQISRNFALKSISAIIGLALVIAFVEFPIVTHDKLLISAFGGFFLGAGIGLSVRGGAVIDGTEVLAIHLSKDRSISVGDIILIFNIMIFTVAIYLLSVETALYAILTYLAASKTVDFIIEGIEEYTGVNIISEKSDEIRQLITMDLGRGVTIYNGKRGYSPDGSEMSSLDIVFTVVTRLEVSKLKREVELIDPQAFIVMHSIKDTKGGMIKKRPLSH